MWSLMHNNSSKSRCMATSGKCATSRELHFSPKIAQRSNFSSTLSEAIEFLRDKFKNPSHRIWVLKWYALIGGDSPLGRAPSPPPSPGSPPLSQEPTINLFPPDPTSPTPLPFSATHNKQTFFPIKSSTL